MALDELAPAERLCRLTAMLGQLEVCPREACAFWEPGGAVLEGRCAFEQLDLSAKPDLAALLLDLRGGLEAAHNQAEEKDVLRHLYRLLNDETDG